MHEINKLKLGQHTFEGVKKLMVRIDHSLIIELTSNPTRYFMERISSLQTLEKVEVQFMYNGEWKNYKGPYSIKEYPGLLVFNKL